MYVFIFYYFLSKLPRLFSNLCFIVESPPDEPWLAKQPVEAFVIFLCTCCAFNKYICSDFQSSSSLLTKIQIFDLYIYIYIWIRVFYLNKNVLFYLNKNVLSWGSHKRETGCWEFLNVNVIQVIWEYNE